MKFEELQYQWTIDCEIDETELSKEAVKIPQLHNKYLIFFHDERLRLRTLRYDHNRLIRQKKDYFGGRMSAEEMESLDLEPFQLKLLKADIDIYIEADDDIINSSKIIAVVEEKVGYLESVVKSLSNRGFIIKNAIDWKRFTEGH